MDSITQTAPKVQPTAHVVIHGDPSQGSCAAEIVFTGPSALDDAWEFGHGRGYHLEGDNPPNEYGPAERLAFAAGYRCGTHDRWNDETARDEFIDEYSSYMATLRRDNGYPVYGSED